MSSGDSLDEQRKENGYWMSQLRSAYMYGRDPHRTLGARDRITQMTARQLRATARRYLDMSRTADVFLVPEAWGQARWLARGEAVEDVGYYRIRPPIKPVTLGELAAMAK